MKDELRDILYSLETFKFMRKDLLTKTQEKNPDIFIGLHSINEKTLCDTYIKKFEVMWLLEHMNAFKKNIDTKMSSEKKDRKKRTIEYFSKQYLEFLELYGREFESTNFGMELLHELQDKFEELIKFSGRWEETYKSLEVIQVKNKEAYNRLLKEMKGE